ncbi:hypothetical protein PCC6912_39590 [Chlorogloeopsis fritschii PCC 6912]|uniref:Uncharacterized protein n=1 Tax=Chlorogloeopsis fritschii PCC 6912 TaxID=211165 RepID=A0A433N673_CHLFR|nr:hypothetical protein [Chlorogloeopsis fritschii]RUR77000.1 hypothetical protein PCC6912_39590 [Chlorogloeopsis fritschii PCC 6912]
MDIDGAIAYIRKWRHEQNLDAFSPQQEREEASKLLLQKGYDIPKIIITEVGVMKLEDGVFQIIKKEQPDAIAQTEESESKLPEPVVEKPVYWSPQDKREFWCEKLKLFVRMTGDLNADGTYWVIQSGEGTFRRYPVKAEDLVLKENAPKEIPTSDFLLINSASWSDIKNCLVNKFIPSYPWSKKGDKQPNQIREDMLAIAKSRKQGLASFIEEERNLGRFEDAQNFVLRMNVAYESFPWGDFAQLLDFN